VRAIAEGDHAIQGVVDQAAVGGGLCGFAELGAVGFGAVAGAHAIRDLGLEQREAAGELASTLGQHG
jgi:hypothetical protein